MKEVWNVVGLFANNLLYANYNAINTLTQLMLPDPYDVPAGCSQLFVDLGVTGDVAGDFPFPEVAIGFGHLKM